MMQWAHGLVALSAGRPIDAYEQLRHMRALPATCPHESVLRRLATADFVDAAVQAGDHASARECVAEFGRWTDQGAASWAILDLARCRALTAHNSTEAEESFRLGLTLAPAVARLAVTARTELSFGSWLRRHKRHREAREHLRSAEHYFDRLDAHTWRDRAHAELRAAGEVTPDNSGGPTLTPQELQIAQLAARGMTNRQIGAALVLSPRTVGYHLYKVFPKLDITSRTQLAVALGEPNGGPGPVN